MTADLGLCLSVRQVSDHGPDIEGAIILHPPLLRYHSQWCNIKFIVSGNEVGMKDQEKTKQPLSAADRQRLFKERQREAGFRHTSVWIHSETEEEGRQAARDGKPLKPIGTKDPLSWAAGWISEKSKQ